MFNFVTMLQKTTSIIVAFFLLLSSTGMAFNIHYCKGKIAAISSVFEKENSCVDQCDISETTCCSSTIDHDDCCTDNLLETSVDDATNLNFSLDFDWIPLNLEGQGMSPFSVEILLVKNISDYTFDSNAPPLYKKYSQLIFYA